MVLTPQMIDLIVGAISFLFTVLIFSYVLGDNPLFRIGVYIFVGVSKKVFLEAGFSNIAAVSYQHGKSTSYNFGNTTTGKSSGFGFSSSLGSFSNNLYFGFRFIIPKNS